MTLRDVTSNKPTEERLKALGAAVEAARGVRRWSVERAAEVAGITAVTWRNVEFGKTRARTAKYAAIEQALRWPSGQCNRILEGDVALAEDPRVSYIADGLGKMTPEHRAMIADLVKVILDEDS